MQRKPHGELRLRVSYLVSQAGLTKKKLEGEIINLEREGLSTGCIRD